MLVLIAYDVNTETPQGKRRLNRIAKVCTNYGQRVQNSVFECSLDNAQLVYVKDMLLGIMDEKLDSLRIYNLGNNYTGKIEHYGAKATYDPGGELII